MERWHVRGEGTRVKAIICTRYGPPEVLQLVDRPVPSPRRGDVRIRIRATSVTSSDTYVRGLRLNLAYRLMARLALGWTAPRQPVLGMVLSGEVDSVGDGVSTFKPGDQVFGFDRHRFGTYAQYVCWPEDGLLAIRPPGLTDTDAAAIVYGGLLALSLVHKAGVGPGQEVLVYGASGAVGTSTTQLARHLGAQVTGVCGPSNIELVRSLGAARVIDYTQQDFSAGSERYDAVLDAVGKRKSAAALKHCARVLTHNGRCISIDDGSPKLLREDLVLLGQLAEAGEIQPVIDRTYALDDIVDAHRHVDGGHKRGNVVISVP